MKSTALLQIQIHQAWANKVNEEWDQSKGVSQEPPRKLNTNIQSRGGEEVIFVMGEEVLFKWVSTED